MNVHVEWMNKINLATKLLMYFPYCVLTTGTIQTNIDII